MAETKKLAAAVRSGTGKGAARSVRREGRIPAVIYGGGEAPTPLSLDNKTVTQLIFAGRFLTTIFEIDIDGKTERAIPRDYQLDVVKDTPLHVDFLRLKPGSRLRVVAPVHFINHEAAPGLKRGGSLNIVYHSVELWVPADNIPELDHRRPHGSRLQRFVAYFGHPDARGLQADEHGQEFHRGERRAAAGRGRGAGRRRRRRASRRRRGQGSGRGKGAGQGREEEEEVTNFPHPVPPPPSGRADANDPRCARSL